MELNQEMKMKITTALYYTPNGISIQKLGIVPDIRIVPAKIEQEFERGDYGEGQFSKALDNTQVQDKKSDKKNIGN